MNDNVYIYNLKQAYFYIQQGLIPLKIQKHYKTKRICFIFNKEKSNPLYTKWLNKKGNLVKI